MRALPLIVAALLTASLARADEPAPSQPPTPPPPTNVAPAPKPTRTSTAMMVTGIVLTSVGVLAAIGGVWTAGAANAGQLGACGATQCTASQQRLGGVFLAIGGGLSVAVGVPLWIVGQRSPPDPGPPAALGFTYRGRF